MLVQACGATGIEVMKSRVDRDMAGMGFLL